MKKYNKYLLFIMSVLLMVFTSCEDNSDYTNPENPGDPVISNLTAEVDEANMTINYTFEGENIFTYRFYPDLTDENGDPVTLLTEETTIEYSYIDLGWGDHKLSPMLVGFGPRTRDTAYVNVDFFVGERSPENVEITIGEPDASGFVTFYLSGINVWSYTIDHGDGTTEVIINEEQNENLVHTHGYQAEGTYIATVTAKAAVDSVVHTETIVIQDALPEIGFYAHWDSKGFNAPFSIDKNDRKEAGWDGVLGMTDGNYDMLSHRTLSSDGVTQYDATDDAAVRLTCFSTRDNIHMAFRLKGHSVLEPTGDYLNLEHQNIFKLLVYANTNSSKGTAEDPPHEIRLVLQSRGGQVGDDNARADEVYVTKYVTSNDEWQDLTFDFSDDSGEWVNADGSNIKPSERTDLDCVAVYVYQKVLDSGTRHRLHFDKLELLKIDGSSNFDSRLP